MNSNTRESLKEFVLEIQYFARAVSAVCGTDAIRDLDEKAEALKKQLDKDETIP